MARRARAFPLLIGLGAALALPSTTSAAAANGGARPEAVSSSQRAGGAAPGQAPSSAAVGRRSGAAVPGRTPAAKPAPAARRAPARRRAPAAAPRRRRATAPRRTPAKAPRRGAARPAPRAEAPAAPTVAGVFPVAGPYTFGGEGARFGADRRTHRHQGQDVVAALGTPLVAPVAGTVTWKANQPAGAGIYLVVRGEDGRDYVFMHLKRGSVRVRVGEAVAPGRQLAEVGSTGSSTGPHLHFEIWVGGWQAPGGAPIDPLPQLRRWAAGG